MSHPGGYSSYWHSLVDGQRSDSKVFCVGLPSQVAVTDGDIRQACKVENIHIYLVSKVDWMTRYLSHYSTIAGKRQKVKRAEEQSEKPSYLVKSPLLTAHFPDENGPWWAPELQHF